MASSRTGLSPHLHFRKRVLARDRAAGITHCPRCNTELDYDISRKPNSAEPDHIIAIANGGTNATSNGRTICRRCNQSIGARNRPESTLDSKPVQASAGW